MFVDGQRYEHGTGGMNQDIKALKAELDRWAKKVKEGEECLIGPVVELHGTDGECTPFELNQVISSLKVARWEKDRAREEYEAAVGAAYAHDTLCRCPECDPDFNAAHDNDPDVAPLFDESWVSDFNKEQRSVNREV